MKPLLYRVAEHLIVAAVLATLWFGPRAFERIIGRPPPDERLIVAVASRDEAAFEQAIADGASPRGRDARGVTALMMAASTGSLDRADRLIAMGADIDAADTGGQTALMLAAITDQPDTARLLLRRGADPNRHDRNGQTALDIARIRGADDVAALLAGTTRPRT